MNITKFIPCENCEQGYIYNSDTVTKCKCLSDWQKKEHYQYKFSLSNLPYNIQNYTIDKYIGDDEEHNLDKLKKYINEFEIKYKVVHLYFWSYINSTQKTTIAQYIANQLLIRNYNVQFILMDNLIHTLMDAQFQYDIRENIEKLFECDFLIIDDCFDTKKVNLYKSGYQISYLDNFLRSRLENIGKATCFTSNLPLSEIGKDWGKSIEELLNRNVPTPMEFKDGINENGEKLITKFKNLDIDELWK